MDPVAVPANAAEFRQAAPAFSSTTMFPDDSVQFWLAVATAMINPCRWDTLTGLGVVLFTEHNLALEAMAAAQGATGGIPGLSTGVIASQSAKSVSVSYDTGLAAVANAGHWNLTTYGTRLLWLINMFGAGPIQCNIGPVGTGFFLPLGDAFGSCGPGWCG